MGGGAELVDGTVTWQVIDDSDMPSDIYVNLSSYTNVQYVSFSYVVVADGYCSFSCSSANSGFIRVFVNNRLYGNCGPLAGGNSFSNTVAVHVGDVVEFAGEQVSGKVTTAECKFIYSISSAKKLGLL